MKTLLFFLALLPAAGAGDEVGSRIEALERQVDPIASDLQRIELLQARYLEAPDPRPALAEAEPLRLSLRARLDAVEREIDAVDELKKSRDLGKFIAASGVAGKPAALDDSDVMDYQDRVKRLSELSRWLRGAKAELERERLSYEQAQGDWTRRRRMLRTFWALAALGAASVLGAVGILRRRRRRAAAFALGTVAAGQYRVVSQAAQTPLGPLYEAEDVELRRPVWLQAFHPDILDDRPLLDKVVEGMRAAARLRHPAILEIYTVLQEGARAALILERGSDASLEARLAGGMRLDPRAAACLFAQAAEALAYVHAQGVVHGALEPGSMLIGQDGGVKLKDFVYGRSARRTRKPTAWEAPELRTGGAPSAASDVYALGALLRETAGSLPAGAEACLSEDPSRRPSAQALAAALRRT